MLQNTSDEFKLLMMRLDNAERMNELLVNELRKVSNKLDIMSASQEKITVSLSDACNRIGIGRTTMMKRIKEGLYPYAFQDVTGHWRFPLDKLIRISSSGC